MTSNSTVETAAADPYNIANKATPREVREWAKSNGYAVQDRGRLSAEVKAAFAEATGKTA